MPAGSSQPRGPCPDRVPGRTGFAASATRIHDSITPCASKRPSLPTFSSSPRSLFVTTAGCSPVLSTPISSTTYLGIAGSRHRSFRILSRVRDKGVIRGMHGRSGRGEAKLVRCAHGAVHDVLVDIRKTRLHSGDSSLFCSTTTAFAISTSRQDSCTAFRRSPRRRTSATGLIVPMIPPRT